MKKEHEKIHEMLINSNYVSIRRLKKAVEAGPGYPVEVPDRDNPGKFRVYKMKDRDIAQAEQTIKDLNRPYTSQQLAEVMERVRAAEKKAQEWKMVREA